MKKEAIIFLLIFSITLATAAPELNIANKTFQPGETILGTITTTGEFAKTISLEDVEFYKGRKQVFFNYDLAYYNNTYFFYTNIPQEGNFTLKIKDVLYKSPELASTSIEKILTVEKQFIDENKTQTKILSISPGLVFTSNQPEVTLKNNGNTDLEIEYFEEEISLSPDNFHAISFIPETQFSYLTIESYETFNIPIIYLPLSQTKPTEISLDLKPSPSLVQVNLIEEQEKTEIIELINFGESNITNIEITSDIEILETEEIQTISAKEVKNISLTFSPEAQGLITGTISISFTQDNEQKLLSIPAKIYILPLGATEEDYEVQDQTCSELAGTICTKDELCTGEIKFTAYGETCCLTSCQEVSSNGGRSYGWLWAVIIIIILAVAGFFTYKKFKKIKPQKPEETLKQKGKIYEKRVSGNLTRN